MFQGRLIATLQRMPGLYDMSAYKPSIYMTPGVIVSPTQMAYMIDQYVEAHPEAKQDYDNLMSEQPGNLTYGIPKKSLHVLFTPEAEPLECSKLLNNLVQLGGEENVFAFDVRKFKADLANHMVILIAASGCIALILFVMTFFQIVVSVQSAVRDDSHELGVLR